MKSYGTEFGFPFYETHVTKIGPQNDNNTEYRLSIRHLPLL